LPISGKLATDACKDDPDHKPVTDWFLADQAPTEYCDMHVTLNICSAKNAVARKFLSGGYGQQVSYILIRPDNRFMPLTTNTCSKRCRHGRTELSIDDFVASMKTCTVHSDGSLSIFSLKTQSQDLIQQATDYLAGATGVPAGNERPAQGRYRRAGSRVVGYQYSRLNRKYQTLQSDFTALQSYMAEQTQNGNGG
jgi:hypothetical protein